jgi:hypothetical protein
VRLVFGSNTLFGGIAIVSALISLYCIPALMDLASTPARHLQPPPPRTRLPINRNLAPSYSTRPMGFVTLIGYRYSCRDFTRCWRFHCEFSIVIRSATQRLLGFEEF